MQIRSIELDFVGIGASRCGTTWISKCLADHPEVFVPAEKELHYYNNRDHMSQRSIESYFSASGEDDVRGEYTPRYMINRTALDHIAHAHPNATIIVSLRDPVERAISQYKQKRDDLGVEEITSFETALTGPYREDYVTKGLYAYHLSTVFDVFDREQIHLVFMESIENEPAAVIEGLYSSIGVDTSFRPSALKRRINESGRETGNIVKTDLQSDEVMIRGQKIGAFDRIERIGGRVLGKLGIKRVVQPTVSNVFHAVREKTESRLSQPASSDGDENNDPSIDEVTKKRVYDTYFADQVEELQNMIERDISQWER